MEEEKYEIIISALKKSGSFLLQHAKVQNISLHSKSLFSIYKLRLIDNNNKKFSIIAKLLPSKLMANREEEGLQAISECGVRVPRLHENVSVDSGSNVLFMDFIHSCSSSGLSQNLLSSLSELYKKTNTSDSIDGPDSHSNGYGWRYNNFIGSIRQYNHWHHKFSDFWWLDRIYPQFQLAHEKKLLEAQEGQQLEQIVKVCSQKWGMDSLSPRLVHGDLWSGNLLSGYSDWDRKKRFYLIDPAVAYSNPEQDLGMLTLFGSPLSTSQIESIAKYVGIGPGFAQRKSFWQIYPLLVHVNLFGSSYSSQLHSTMQDCMRWI